MIAIHRLDLVKGGLNILHMHIPPYCSIQWRSQDGAHWGTVCLSSIGAGLSLLSITNQALKIHKNP